MRERNDKAPEMAGAVQPVGTTEEADGRSGAKPTVTFHMSDESMMEMKAYSGELWKNLERGNPKFRELESLELKFCEYMEYRGYRAKVEFDDQDNIHVGTVMGIKDMLAFHGSSTVGMAASFINCIEDYIAFRGSIGKEAEHQEEAWG